MPKHFFFAVIDNYLADVEKCKAFNVDDKSVLRITSYLSHDLHPQVFPNCRLDGRQRDGTLIQAA